MQREERMIINGHLVFRNTQCECKSPKPRQFGRWSTPSYLCESCGKNITIRVESGEVSTSEEPMKTYLFTCHVCQQKTDRPYCYTDQERGMKDVRICPQCLHKHVKQYYPDCPVQKQLEYIYPELAKPQGV